MRGFPLMMRDGASLVGASEIAAIEWYPLSLQTADARVLVHLRGGRTITEYFGQQWDSDKRAEARYDAILAELNEP